MGLIRSSLEDWDAVKNSSNRNLLYPRGMLPTDVGILLHFFYNLQYVDWCVGKLLRHGMDGMESLE